MTFSEAFSISRRGFLGAMAGAAVAATGASAASSDVKVLDVPKEFDHEPTQKYSIARLPAREQQRACGGIKNACALPKRNVIVLDKDLESRTDPQTFKKILSHEKAHLNGWTH